MLTNNETKYIIKVIRSLENREIFLKETIRKIDNQEGRLFNFLGPLTRAALLLVKIVLTPLPKNVLVPL